MSQNVQASVDARTVVPDRVVVFELRTDVNRFVTAAAGLGFEWLASALPRGDDELRSIHLDDVDDEDDDFPNAGLFDDEDAGDDDGDVQAPTDDIKPEILYLTMPSREGMSRLLGQWAHFSRGEEPSSPEYRGLWELFDYLVAMRRWSIQDRLDPLLADYIERSLEADADEPVRVEVDLWYRATLEERDLARATLLAVIQAVRGRMLDLVTIPEIRYQGALVELPPAAARRLLEHTDGNRIGQLDAVMAVRPQSAFASIAPGRRSSGLEVVDLPGTTKPIVSAMLDGYPVTGHTALAGLVRVREVEVTGEAVPVNARFHGTAMASLIVRGDLHEGGQPISRQLLAVPILTDSGNGIETTPRDMLPIGVVYRALNNLVAEMRQPNSELRNLTVINHAVCDVFAPFVRRPTPWAMLLDHFSYQHNLLFVVSAGNITEGITLPDFDNVAELQAATPLQRQAAFINAVEREKGRRGILSPAESINSLTIGALHAEAATNAAEAAIDPFPLTAVTNLASAIGLGVNDAIKPDLVEHGGRVAAQCANLAGGGVVATPFSSNKMGQRVAAPSRSGDLTYTRRSAGTSNAAALVTRGLNFVADALDDLYLGGPSWSQKSTRAPLLKALATHTSSWGSVGNVLEDAYPPQENPHDHFPRRRTIARFLGYGRSAITRAVGSTSHRATLVAEDSIAAGKQHIYRIPLPPSLLNTRTLRTITVTLAWTSPITPNADYRGMRLTVLDQDRSYKFWNGVKRGKKVLQPDHFLVEKGTLMHIRLRGQNIGAVLGPDGLYFGVHATANHPAFDEAVAPYALAISIEIAQSARTNLFDEVQAGLRARATRIAALARQRR